MLSKRAEGGVKVCYFECAMCSCCSHSVGVFNLDYALYNLYYNNNINNDNNNDKCFQNVDQVTILHSPSFLLYCPARFGLFLNPAPLEVNGACPGADAPLFGAVAAVIDTGGCFSLRQSTFGKP